MMLNSHGTTALHSGSALLETDYRPGDVGPGLLKLRLEDQRSFESVEGQIRLDPWRGGQYPLIETGSYFLICGAQAVVAVDSASLAWLSSVALEYEEGETIDLPWHVEAKKSLIVATERRVWRVDENGAIRWIWSCTTSDQHRWISGVPVAAGGRVHIPLKTFATDLSVAVRLGDGLPTTD